MVRTVERAVDCTSDTTVVNAACYQQHSALADAPAGLGLYQQLSLPAAGLQELSKLVPHQGPYS